MLKRFLSLILFIFVILIAMLYWSVSSTDQIFGQSEILQPKEIGAVNLRNYDSVLVAASSVYKADFIKNIMQGKHYREAWAAPSAVKLLFLDTLFGGVTILKEGGGNQTHSLKLKDSSGIDYALRSVNKDPAPLIPNIARTLKVENIIVDGISAQHPYGAILVAKLADGAKIIHTKPQMVFLPKQEALGDYNAKFGNRLFLLEYDTKSDVNWTNLSNITELHDTDGLQDLKQEQGKSITIDKSVFIRARLFDFLIGDWDRHAKQYGWAIQKNGENLKAIPIPGDRDNAFFNNGGLIPKLLSNRFIVPRLRPFDEDIDFMEGLVYPVDRYFLLNTEVSLFTSEAKALQDMLTDDVIDAAFEVWPARISALNQEEISKKIKSRRADLLKYAKAFKAEIDRQGILDASLKGSEHKTFVPNLLKCFECNN